MGREEGGTYLPYTHTEGGEGVGWIMEGGQEHTRDSKSSIHTHTGEGEEGRGKSYLHCIHTHGGGGGLTFLTHTHSGAGKEGIIEGG